MALGNHGFDANKNVYDLSSLEKRVAALETSTKCPFPVGSIYISIRNVNPGSTWTGTSWTGFGSGRTLIGVNPSDSNFSGVEKTGGSATTGNISVSVRGNLPANTGSTALNTSQIPAHAHYVRLIRDSVSMSDQHIYTEGIPGGSNTYYHLFPGNDTATTATAGAINRGTGFGTATRPLTTFDTGSGAGHTHSIGGSVTSTGTIASINKLMPYITVYFWKRTA